MLAPVIRRLAVVSPPAKGRPASKRKAALPFDAIPAISAPSDRKTAQGRLVRLSLSA